MGEAKETIKGQGLKGKDIKPKMPPRRVVDTEKQPTQKRNLLQRLFDAVTDKPHAPITDRSGIVRDLSVEGSNIIDYVEGLRDEISRLTQIKDDDTFSEGDSMKAENSRKAGQLRAVHSLLTTAKSILEDY